MQMTIGKTMRRLPTTKLMVTRPLEINVGAFKATSISKRALQRSMLRITKDLSRMKIFIMKTIIKKVQTMVIKKVIKNAKLDLSKS
jgi:hypothetical protein